jgi:UrcA family protein
MSRNLLLLSAALLATTPIFACAGEVAPGKPETAAASVVIAGLDLSTTAGMAQARKRLSVMAARLCRKFRDDRKAADWANYVDCVHDTVASALERIPTPASSLAKN